MRYDKEKRVFMVENYVKFKNATKVQRAWRSKFKNIEAPTYSTVLYNYRKFEKTGSVNFTPSEHKKMSKKREEAKNEIEILLEEDPSLSVRKLAVAVGVSYSLTRDILLEDLHLKPYKIHEYHKLEPADYKKRVNFASYFLSLPARTKKFLICTDEAYFYLHESTNSQNNRRWTPHKPLDKIEVPLQGERILVWCGISASRIYGPFFFESTVNQHNYLDMLKTFFWRKHLSVANYKKYYFQQDGATCHTANSVQDWLKDKFSAKFFQKNRWPARSPDMNPCDFFLWGYLKSLVYKPLPKTLEDLKANVAREIKNIKKEMLENTFDNFVKRCHSVIDSEGGHIDDK